MDTFETKCNLCGHEDKNGYVISTEDHGLTFICPYCINKLVNDAMNLRAADAEQADRLTPLPAG